MQVYFLFDQRQLRNSKLPYHAISAYWTQDWHCIERAINDMLKFVDGINGFDEDNIVAIVIPRLFDSGMHYDRNREFTCTLLLRIESSIVQSIVDTRTRTYIFHSFLKEQKIPFYRSSYRESGICASA